MFLKFLLVKLSFHVKKKFNLVPFIDFPRNGAIFPCPSLRSDMLRIALAISVFWQIATNHKKQSRLFSLIRSKVTPPKVGTIAIFFVYKQKLQKQREGHMKIAVCWYLLLRLCFLALFKRLLLFTSFGVVNCKRNWVKFGWGFVLAWRGGCLLFFEIMSRRSRRIMADHQEDHFLANIKQEMPQNDETTEVRNHFFFLLFTFFQM